MRAGLTGGIATGKSTVARILRELGAGIADADGVAHEVLGLPHVVREIAAHFGPDVLDADGSIDRTILGGLVFSDDSARRWLNDLVHPQVWLELDARMNRLERESPAQLALADVPLLVETGQAHRYGPLVVVWCPLELQLTRLQNRDGCSLEEALARIAAQAPIDEKRLLADHVVDTSGTLEQTRKNTLRLFHALQGRSPSPPDSPDPASHSSMRR